MEGAAVDRAPSTIRRFARSRRRRPQARIRLQIERGHGSTRSNIPSAKVSKHANSGQCARGLTSDARRGSSPRSGSEGTCAPAQPAARSPRVAGTWRARLGPDRCRFRAAGRTEAKPAHRATRRPHSSRRRWRSRVRASQAMRAASGSSTRTREGPYPWAVPTSASRTIRETLPAPSCCSNPASCKRSEARGCPGWQTRL